MALQDEGMGSPAEQDLPSRDPRLETAEAWIGEAAEEGCEEALIYLRSRGHPCKEQIEKLREQWTADEQYFFQQWGWTNPQRPPASRTNLDTLPGTFGNFWADRQIGKLLDASMLRAAQWCAIDEFAPWWKRLEHCSEGLMSVSGLLDAGWLFAMARSDTAVGMPFLKRYLEILSSFSEDEVGSPIAHWSAVIFAHYRLRLEGSTVVTQMLNRLFRERDADGVWRTWLHDSEPSIKSTAMALHALALAHPFGWKSLAEDARDWLWSRQDSDGSWYGPDPVYLTVLVLDAINLADENGPTTFTVSSGSTDEISGQSWVAQRNSSGSPKAVAACRRYMRANALTQKAFAERVGTTDRTIRQFLKDGNIQKDLFNAMATAMGITPEELHYGRYPAE